MDAEPKLVECIEPHVTTLEIDGGLREYAFRRTDKLPADHVAVLAHPQFWAAPGESASAAGLPIAATPEPESEPELPPGAVRMRTRSARKGETFRVSFPALDGSPRVAGPCQEIITSKRGASNLQQVGAAERV